MTGSSHPLWGFRVVDLCDGRGELAGRLLGDLGADVIRVEPPEGARSRRLPPFYRDTSLYFTYRNTNKRGIALDLSRAGDRGRLESLLRTCDVLLESARPGERAALDLEPRGLSERHSHLVVTSITDFGQTGPYRDWIATDAVLEAMGGMVFKAGVPERPPLIPPATLAYDVSAVTAAFATVAALWQRERTGAGQHIDFSCLEGTAQTADWSFCNASALREGGYPINELRMGSAPAFKVYDCKNGYVRLLVISPRQWRAMWDWLGRPEAFADPHWERVEARREIDELLTPLYEEHFARMTKEEASAEAQRRGIVCTPVLRPHEVLANEHLNSRKALLDVEVAPDVRGRTAAGFIEMDGERQGFRTPAPAIGEHTEEVLAEASRLAPRSGPPKPAPPSAPFTGLLVLDFGTGGVGVEGGRFFAEYGADVIKLESRSHPDFVRVFVGTEMTPSFASSNRSKRCFGANTKDPEGLALVHRLVEQADVVIENGSKGAMERMGVGHAKLRELNPGLVMVSSQLLGSHGVWSEWVGYGPSTQALGGLVHLWDYGGEGRPAGCASIFPDHLAGRLVALTAVAGILRRSRTGRGAHGEVAQIEAVTGMLGDLLLEESLEPGSVRPRGNESEQGAPWGAYPCAGEQQWCVITARNDADWAALRTALGDPTWARDPDLGTSEGRLGARADLDRHLSQWTQKRDKCEIAELLQRHGVPCGPMLTGTGQLDDPHFRARGYPRFVNQQGIGRIAVEGPCFRATGMTEARVEQAPWIAEHNREICRELLGLDDAEVDRLIESGALDRPPEGDA